MDEYRAATETLAFRDRSARGRLEVTGRAPVRMLDGVVTGSVPAGIRETLPGVASGRASYSAVLTPKGRMVTDLRILRLDPGAAEAGKVAGPVGAPATLPTGGPGDQRLLLEVPEAGTAPLVAHFTRFLPPRFARVEDVGPATGMLTLTGPDAPRVLSRDVLGLRVEEHELDALAEGEFVTVEAGGAERIMVVRNRDVATPAFDVLADRVTIRAVARRLTESGIPPLGEEAWRVLRVEAGRPEFGEDMDDETIPIEAGIHGRAIDYGKGCYTGQEVIVRIRDRGHVNRSLRGLRLGGAEVPEPGAELFAPDVRGDRPVGRVTSAVRSPRRGETLALGYVRREVEPGAVVRVGSASGAEATVVSLDGDDWSGQG